MNSTFINSTNIQENTVAFAGTSIRWFLDRPIFAGLIIALIILALVIIGKQFMDWQETGFQTFLFGFAVYFCIVLFLVIIIVLVDTGEITIWKMIN